ncbi:aminodeoxychorismate lyase [Catenovulum sp. 2E275]|uniref:aminodeoxychorismate lyase n=1 Tax=Catenovulum sp. 2E275 TaxID=2980497 RepID=UPI0021CDFE02|nr:aminodeoxychorismate lyase [Catenovulum sp. 2E275]MCU4674775.1 aminodeoxychorismate lyase [Catenovulum sp. 2E275]
MKLIQVDSNHHQVSAFNRAFQFGDGHFTTLLIENYTVHLWHLHKQRLIHANQVLLFPDLDFTQIEASLNQIAQTGLSKIVKILISRGNSARGYAVPDAIEAEVYLYISDYLPQQFQYPDGVELGIVKTVIGQQPSLAGLKHCNRLEQVLIKQELLANKLTDGLVLDQGSNIIETSLANVFFYLGDSWITPDLSLSGVSGVMRTFALEQLQALGLSVKVAHISINELDSIQAGFITNALIKATPINNINGKKLNLEFAKTITRKLNEAVG